MQCTHACCQTSAAAPQGSADKVDVLRQVLAEAPQDAWLLWADFDTVFANRAFSFPFAQYEAEGRHMVLGGTLSEVLAGNGYSKHLLLLTIVFQLDPASRDCHAARQGALGSTY
jgi:hypothetical protein